MASTTDVRAWLLDNGYEVKGNGRIPADLRASYDDAHRPGGPADDPSDAARTGAVSDYDGGVTVADFPPPPDGEPAEPAPAVTEIRPRKVKAPRAGPLALLRGGARTKSAKPPRSHKAKAPRVSLAGLIEDAWGQLAWAAAPIPPMQKLLYAQGPYAGIALEDAVRGTMVDRWLQPIAQAEEKAKAVGGLVLPPMALMAVLATAPQPQQIDTDTGPQLTWPEPSIQHKGALLSLRWSLMLMAEAGAMHLDEYQAKAAATEERGRQADAFMAWILGADMPEEAPAAAEEEAVKRAQQMFGAGPADNS